MEIASIVVSIALVILFWSTLKELLAGITGNTRRVIRVTDKTTRKWLADASIEELATASAYCSARGWVITKEAEYEAYLKALDIEEAEPASRKKLAEELRAILLNNQPTPTPTPAPTPAP
jgi:hypothetical protein